MNHQKPQSGLKKKRMSAQDRRKMILEKASHLFAQRGLYGVTTKEIATACGVSEPVLYQHFKTKEDIYQGLESLCQGHTALSEQLIDGRKPSTETLCMIVYLLNTMIVHSRLPGSDLKSKDAENLTRLAGHSFVADGAFVSVLLRDCIGRFFPAWCQAYEAARKEESLLIDAADDRELWLSYELMLGSALFHLNADKLLKGLHGSSDFIDRISLFMLRGLGVKPSSIEKFYHPKTWDEEFQKLFARMNSEAE